MGATVIPCGNPSPVLEPSKHDFYLVPLFIKLFIIRHCLFPAAPAKDAGRDSLAEQRIAKPVGIIAPICQKFSGLRQRSKQDGSAFVIAYLTACQVKRYRLAGSIANGMKF